MMTRQEYNELAGWDCKEVDIVQSMIINPDPILFCNLFKQNNNKWCSSPSNIINKKEVTGCLKPELDKRGTKSVDRVTIKKPRSPYSLFFQIERELIIAELSCSPPA
eukprot:2368600-Ditylum_brightwellii.AAC.1